jgi:hypothetical protein
MPTGSRNLRASECNGGSATSHYRLSRMRCSTIGRCTACGLTPCRCCIFCVQGNFRSVDELRLAIGMTDELQQDLAPLPPRAGEVGRQVATAAMLGALAEVSQRDAREKQASDGGSNARAGDGRGGADRRGWKPAIS